MAAVEEMKLRARHVPVLRPATQIRAGSLDQVLGELCRPQ
jgi:hypothetical protein